MYCIQKKYRDCEVLFDSPTVFSLFECDFDKKCFKEPVQGLVERYAMQILNTNSDISGSEEAEDACKVVVRAMNGFIAMKQVCTWEAPLRFLLVQAFHPTSFIPCYTSSMIEVYLKWGGKCRFICGHQYVEVRSIL